MLRKGNFKLQVDMMGNYSLFDLEKDPVELENLWYRCDYYEIRQRMTEELLVKTLELVDVLPVPQDKLRVKV
jgi:hypothetical protein